MVQAAYLHAQEHKGYMPFAGHPGPWAQGIRASSVGLGDPERVRYMYVNDGDIGWRPLPLTVALGYYMNVPIICTRPDDLRPILKDENLQRLFACPSQTERQPGWTVYDSGDGWIGTRYAEYSSYTFNAWVLCVSPAPEGGMAPGGKLTRVRQLSEVFLFADGNNSPKWGNCGYGVQWGATNTDTLYDAWINFDAGTGHQLDHTRHRNKLNVAFVDGHAETVDLPTPIGKRAGDSRGDLDRIGLLKGVAFE
jgi:prepilin-type processing-associated H-X9-DG protein